MRPARIAGGGPCGSGTFLDVLTARARSAPGAPREPMSSPPDPRPAPPLDDAHLLRAVFDAFPEPLYVIDVRDYALRLANKASGLEHAVGTATCFASTHGLTLPCTGRDHPCPLQEVLRTGQPARTEHVHVAPDGTSEICEVNGYPLFGDGRRVTHVIEHTVKVTAHRRAEDRLRLQGAAIEATEDAIFITDREGKIEWMNGAFRRLSGYSEAEAIGRTPRLLKSGRHDADHYRRLWTTILRGEAWHGSVVNRHKSGRLYMVEQKVTPMRDAHGEISHFVAIHHDVTSQMLAEDRMRHLARFDFLTDLPNRFVLDEILENEIARAGGGARPVTLLLIDLDRFRDVNDSFGLTAGDAALVAVAQRLRETVADAGHVARFGADEFAVVPTGVEGLRGVAQLARRLQDAIARPLHLEGRDVLVTASLGVTLAAADGIEPRSLVDQADLALSRAKKEGGHLIRFYSDELDREAKARTALSRDLPGALERGELSLEFQPQVRLEGRRVVGAEALLRWHHPDWGLVRPPRFVPLAERNGLVVPLGEWVLRTACRHAVAWRQADGSSLVVAVNLSPVQLRDPHLPQAVAEILDETGLAPECLELELTEGILFQTTDVSEATIKALHEIGVRFALDDFGKGYSSLAYLRRFPLSKLKIDRSFVREVANDPHDAAIVSAVIALGRNLRLDVVAEGVETPAALRFLGREGCPLVQGYLLGRPVPAAAFSELLGASG